MTHVTGLAKFALIGAFSGALYALWNFGFLVALEGNTLVVMDAVIQASNETGAGLFYGVIAGAALRRPLGWNWVRWLLYVVAGGLSYMAAVNLAVALHEYQQTPTITALSGAAAGALGAALFSGATAALSPAARHFRFFALTIFGGAVFGLLLPIALDADQLAMWIGFFALWQAAYAAATASGLGLKSD